MLSCETERRLKNYLVAVAEGESNLERLRQRLCEIRDFTPCMAFQRLDRCANEFLTSIDLLNFERDNCIYSTTETENYRLLKFFDSDEDGRLSYNDFIQILLPCEDKCLRQIALSRHSCRVARYENLPFDIERGISGILEREIELIRRLDTVKRDLETRHDFSPYAAFKTIDRCTEGALTSANLTLFLRGQGFYPTEREVLSIIRRMDTSSAAQVSYSDFTDFLRGHGSADIYSSTASSPVKRAKSAEKNSSGKRESLRESLAKARSSSAIRTSPKKACCSTCERKSGACERKVIRPCSPCRPVVCRERCSPCKPSCCECPCRPYHICRPDDCLCRCRIS
jgi:Ca2+-binding EF-hand superfamily protein